MKNILIITVSFFLFIGCTPKQEIVISKDKVEKPSKPVIEEILVTEPEPEPVVLEETVIEDDGLNKVAVIYPSKIVGKYAKSTISTISAFLIFNDKKFQIEAFDTYDEDPENIMRELSSLNEKGFTKVIAMFTQNGFNILNSIQEAKLARFYFPLIHKSEVVTENKNFIFGGISYKDQLDLLQTLSNGRNTMFYVKSYRGNKLKEAYINSFLNPGLIKEIERKQNNYKTIMKDQRMIGNTILLNTPIVKSSILLSQITAFEINPNKILSTQLNYNPLLIKLTQDRDREKFYIVNSISEVDSFIEEYTKILGSDIIYNWVDYSSLVGANFLLNENESEIINTKIIENQADYVPTLYKSTSYGFEKVLPN